MTRTLNHCLYNKVALLSFNRTGRVMRKSHSLIVTDDLLICVFTHFLFCFYLQTSLKIGFGHINIGFSVWICADSGPHLLSEIVTITTNSIFLLFHLKELFVWLKQINNWLSILQIAGHERMCVLASVPEAILSGNIEFQIGNLPSFLAKQKNPCRMLCCIAQ